MRLLYNVVMVVSLKRKKHLEKLAEMKRGKPSPLRGRKVGPFSKEHIEKLRKAQRALAKRRVIWNKGKTGIYSKDTLKKMSLAKQGIKLTEEHKKKIFLSSVSYWSDKVTKANRRSPRKIRRWRRAVFKRDNYTCQKCKVRGGSLESHHIKSYANFPKLRYKVSNGVTLCIVCHKKVDPHRK